MLFSQPYMRGIVAAVGVMAVLALASYTYLTLKEAKYTYTGPVVINVTGNGEAVAVPDIASFTFSVRAEADTASAAQEESATAINEITAYLKDEGIAEADIKTAYYNVNPVYEWTGVVCREGYCPPGEQVLRGYEANQTIEVKVRDTSKAGELISGVGSRGATNVSGVQFTIDDEESIKAEARANAIADAQTKAEKLAGDLDVRIVRMTGYWENEYSQPYYDGYGAMESSVMSKDSSATPDLPAGENTMTVQVNLSFEVN